ncbi:hypothetical protein RJ640_001642 [Escallonia rubra]|uniref:Uncharacterized protein n=1 Tax=Escallonia rubra TaxID=112253 RepID=A0AA88QZE3_9ASTE|nr:hypothetical protein RJ640_001642 [Escallonia rubra]
MPTLLEVGYDITVKKDWFKALQASGGLEISRKKGIAHRDASSLSKSIVDVVLEHTTERALTHHSAMRVRRVLEVFRMGTVNYLDALKLQEKLVTDRKALAFHGPHQAILYPIISLRDIGHGARNYVEKLKSSMIELASLYGVKARAGQAGETRRFKRETNETLPAEEVIDEQLISCFARLFGYTSIIWKDAASKLSSTSKTE